MNTEKEIEKLKKEVADLKRDLAELKQFFEIKPAGNRPKEKVLTITCSHIFLKNSDDGRQLGGVFGFDDNGPVMELWGKDMLSRVTLEVDEEVGRLILYNAEREPGVEVGVNEETQTGLLIISHDGNPRVVMKGDQEGGTVSLVHDDALMRVGMESRQDHGRILVVNSDMKPAVTISTDEETSGGYVELHHANGKTAISLGTDGKEGSAVFVNSNGKVTGVAPENYEGGASD